MRLLHLVPLAAGLAFSTPAFASDADPDPVTCKGIAGMQFGAAGLKLTASRLALAFTPDDARGLALQAEATKQRARATALGYALAGEAAPPNGEDYFSWQVSRLDTVFANCEKKHAAQINRPQKWVALDIGRDGTVLAVDVFNIRPVGARRAINVMVGFAEPVDGGDGKFYSATVNTFSFDCAARGNAISTLQILFNTGFEQQSLAPTADQYPYGPNSQLAQYERLACGDETVDGNLPSASDMVAAAQLTFRLAVAQEAAK